MKLLPKSLLKGAVTGVLPGYELNELVEPTLLVPPLFVEAGGWELGEPEPDVPPPPEFDPLPLDDPPCEDPGGLEVGVP